MDIQTRKEWVVWRRETAETEAGMLMVLKVQIKNVGKLWLDKSQLI